jgi:hypothetical protein
MTTSLKKLVIMEPDCRGGATAPVVRRGAAKSRRSGREADSFVAKVLSNLRNDQNLIYLAARLQSYSESCDARLVSLRQAVASGDGPLVVEVSHGLTECTARLGAVRMMKLCIALQMVGRRGLLAKAELLLGELEVEYARFKESLISAVG